MAQVRSVAHATDEHAGAMLPAERSGQPGPPDDRDVVPVRGKFLAYLSRPFRWAGGRLLVGVDGHEHGDPREMVPCSVDDVEMTGCDGVEGAGIDRMLPRPAPAGRVGHRPMLPGPTELNLGSGEPQSRYLGSLTLAWRQCESRWCTGRLPWWRASFLMPNLRWAWSDGGLDGAVPAVRGCRRCGRSVLLRVRITSGGLPGVR